MTINKNSVIRNILDKIRKYLDFILGFENLKGVIADLHGKQILHVDILRNEILLELKHGQATPPKSGTHILNIQKYEKLLQQNELVLNIGAGNNCIDSMVNVDMRELPNIDIISDAAYIQLPNGIAKGIYSAHVLEHFPHEKLRRSVLPNWVSLLNDGGYFRAIVPDAEGMIAAYTRGEMSFADFRTVTFGLQEYEGDIHYTIFSRDSLKTLLEEAGLNNVNYVAISRPNGLCLEMEVLAYK